MLTQHLKLFQFQVNHSMGIETLLMWASIDITSTSRHIRAAAEAIPDIRCTKFRAILSASSRLRALPCTVPNLVPFDTLSPSLPVHVTTRLESTCLNICTHHMVNDFPVERVVFMLAYQCFLEDHF